MTTPRFLVGILLLCALPVLAQPDTGAINGLPYPLIPSQNAALLTETGPIKLHVHDKTLKEVLKEVEQQTGIGIETRFNLGTALHQKLSLDIETNSLKEATDAIFQAVGVDVTLQKSGMSRQWNIFMSPQSRWAIRGAIRTHQYSGKPVSGIAPFQIWLRGVNTTPVKQLTPGENSLRPQKATLSARFAFDTDSHLPLIEKPDLEITRAEDEKGRSLRDENNFSSFSNDSYRPLTIELLPPEQDAHLIAHLEGKAVYIIASKWETWEVPDVLNAKGVAREFQSGNSKVRISIASARKTNERVEIGVTVAMVTPRIPINHRPGHPLLHPQQLSDWVRLVDAQGQILESRGFVGSCGVAQLTGQLVYLLPRAVGTPPPNVPLAPRSPILAEPLKLVINVPTDIVQTEVPFSFSDIPLP